ncbi:MAG: hypothetical protein ACTSUE_01655 [Promethearchaeota archaeon]
MVFNKARKMIVDITRGWQKVNLERGIAGYYDNFEENKARNIQQDIESYEKAINDLSAREKELKKELKKDKKKQETMEEVKKHLKEKSRMLKNVKKELSDLPKTIKSIKSDFREKIKRLSKFVYDLDKIINMESKGGGIEAEIKKIDEFITLLEEINKVVPLDEIISHANLEFKIVHETGIKKFKRYKKLLIFIYESLAARLVHHALSQKLEEKKREFLKKAHKSCREIISINKKERFLINYYQSFNNLVTALHVISIGVSKVKEYDYVLATQYFLKARALLIKLGDDFKKLDITSQSISLSRAYASDAYNIIYLLNSFYNWKNILEKAEGEMKEIAQISVNNIQEWVTRQYGFPPTEKIEIILKTIIWPKPVMPKINWDEMG